MAQLRDTVVSGSLRATDTIYTNKIQTTIIGAPTSSNGTTFGVGTNGQVLKSNGTSVYWSSDSGVTSVRVQATSPVTSSTNTAQTGSLDTTIALANNYGDTKNPYASKTKNTVLAAPATADGVPLFRALVADDIPTISAAKASLGNVSNNAKLNSTTGAKGDIIYWSATNTPAHLTNTSSTTKQFLSITSQVPAWSAVSKGDVGLGNVENTALSTWTGSNKITTVGTIGTGTWQGTAIGATYVGNLPASKINSGTFDAARIPTLSITDKTTGTLTVDRGGTGVTTASPHCVLAGPKTGTAAAAPTWRNIDSTDIKPILSKTYENYTVTANDGNAGVIYFATVTPANTSNYFAPWWVHYTLEVTTTENQTQGFYDVYWGQAGTTITYHIFNNFYSGTYYPIYNHRVLYPKDGQQSKGAHLGVRIQSARNPTTLARTYKVNILEYSGCTVALKDSLTTYQSLYNSTYYNSGEYNGTSAGLQETGDADTTGRDYSHSAYLTNGSTLRLPPFSLYGLDRENKAQAFSLYSADYTSSTTNINTARVYNTAGIDWTRGIWCSNSWTNFAKSADLNISPSFMYYAVDFRYTDNCIAAASATTLGLVARKPVFFRGYIKEDGLFYLDPLSVTYNNATYKRAWTQDIPTSKTYNGTYQHVYWKIGDVYYNGSYAGSGYQVNLLVENKLYWYNNNRFEEYGGDANTVNGHTINADVPSGAKFTDTNTWRGIQDNLTSDSATDSLSAKQGKALANGSARDSTKLPLAGGTMTGTLTLKGSNAADSYSGALNANNSNIYGLNSIYTADASDGASEGIHFYRDSTHVDSLWMNGGDLLFVPNRALGTNTTKANSEKVARLPASVAGGQLVMTDGTTGKLKTGATTQDLHRPTALRGFDDPTLQSLVSKVRANRLAFLPGDQIIIEKTTDGGATWVDAGISDDSKSQIFSDASTGGVSVPLIDGVRNLKCGLRITITAMKYNVPAGTPETEKHNYWNVDHLKSSGYQERYCTLKDFYFYISGSADSIGIKIEREGGKANHTWSVAFDDSSYYMTGWSGVDYVRIPQSTFGGGSDQTDRYWNYRFTFMTKGQNGTTTMGGSATQAQWIYQINAYGDNVWFPSLATNPLMVHDHMYSFDRLKNVTFPAKVTATDFSGKFNGHTINADVPSGAKFTDTTSFTITANATDGYWNLSGTNGTNAVTYSLSPYSSKQSGASFYTGTTNPDGTTRLNYNGYLYGTKLYSGGAEVLTSHQSLSGYVTKSTLSTIGDIFYASAANTPSRLAGNTTTTRKFLRSVATTSGTAMAPAWDTVTKADVGLGNVENTALSTWAGTNKIVTVGTITSGTWQGTTVAVNHGGTGATSFTANSVIMSGSTTTAALTTRAITDNSSNADVTSSDTNLITGRTLYYQLAKKGYLTYHQTIIQDGLTGSIVNRYTDCTTAADIAEKKISFNSGTLNQVTGATLRVRFKYSNTAANPTLNINNSGNVPIYKFGTTRPGTTPEDSWSAGEVVTFVYDGTGWQMSSNPIMGLTASQVANLFNLIG